MGLLLAVYVNLCTCDDKRMVDGGYGQRLGSRDRTEETEDEGKSVFYWSSAVWE